MKEYTEFQKYLHALGLNPDTAESLISLLKRMNYYKELNDGVKVGLSYEELKNTFRNGSQSYPQIKKTILAHVLTCDFEAEKDVKTYGYSFKKGIDEKLLDHVLVNRKNRRRDNRVFNNKKNRLLKLLSTTPPQTTGDLLYHDLGVNDDLCFKIHNIDLFSKLDETTETETVLLKELAALESEKNSKRRHSKRCRVIGIVSNLESIFKLRLDIELKSPDGRWHTAWTSLPAEVRKTLTANGMSYLCALDIRSCHPSFFAEYIISLKPNPSADLIDERDRWNNYFLNSADHPVKQLALTLGVKYDDTLDDGGNIAQVGLKECLCGYINGKGFVGNTFNRNHRDSDVLNPLNDWIKSNFPLIYTEWRGTDVKTTGNKISKIYESRIMQDRRIFIKAKELGVYLANEHDGVGFFGKDVADAQKVIDEIKAVAFDLFKLHLVISKK